jgi:hypothetical protein
MKRFTILSSETVCYETEVEAESEDQALDIFYNLRITDESKILNSASYEGFQIDSVSVEVQDA